MCGFFILCVFPYLRKQFIIIFRKPLLEAIFRLMEIAGQMVRGKTRASQKFALVGVQILCLAIREALPTSEQCYCSSFLRSSRFTTTDTLALASELAVRARKRLSHI